MTIDEWLEKAEYEGINYAVVEWGLTEDMLDEDLHGGEFYELVKNYRLAAEKAAVFERHIESWMEE